MDAESNRKRLREEGTCTVCLDFFKDPVTLDCGHSFCRACIAKCWVESPEDPACPQCSERVPAPRLPKMNQKLANLAQIAKELNELPTVCEHHQEPLQLVCVGCDRSRQHRACRLGPMGGSVQDQICHFLEILREERENILWYKRENEKETQDLLGRLQAESEKPAAAFSQLGQFLEEKKTLWQAQMGEVGKEIAGRSDQYQSALFAELSSLDSLIRELEEKQQLSADELPQNLGNILERCQRKPFLATEAYPGSLKKKIRDLPKLNSFLEAITKRFQDTLVFRLQFQDANGTLDPDTANPQLILSQDGKSVSRQEEEEDLPDKPERFDKLPIVLCREGFTSGCHFWDVAVRNGEEWAVGIARKSVRRKAGSISHLRGIWDFGNWRGEYRVSIGRTPLSLSQELKKIRVTLNYEEGQVAFFNADTEAHLHTYSGASFDGETVLPYFYVGDKGSLTLLF